MIIFERKSNNRIPMVSILMFLAVLIIMASLITFIWVPSLKTLEKYNEIKNTGIHTTATANNIEFAGENNDVNYYRLCYVFNDANEEQHNGKTREQYTLNQAIQYAQAHIQIEIIYNPETFESIEASYNPSNMGLWILPLVAIIFVVAFSIPLISDIKNIKQAKNGTNNDHPINTNTNAGNFKTKTNEDFVTEWQTNNFREDAILGFTPKDFKTQFITLRSTKATINEVESFIDQLIGELMAYNPSENDLERCEQIVLRESRKAEDFIIKERKLEESNINIMTLEKLKEIEEYYRKEQQELVETENNVNNNPESSNADIYKYENPFK